MSVHLQADLTVDLLSSGKTLSTVSIATSPDGVMNVTSSGSLPKFTVSKAITLMRFARRLVRATGQSVNVVQGSRQLILVTKSDGEKTRTTIRWWSIIRTLVTPDVSTEPTS